MKTRALLLVAFLGLASVVQAQNIAGNGAFFQVGGSAPTDASSAQRGAVMGVSSFTAASDVTNAVLLRVIANAAYGGISVEKTGAALYQPFIINTNGVEALRVTTAGTLLLGATSSDVSLTAGSIETIGNNTTINAVGATTNASLISIGVTNGSYTFIASNKSGAGTYLDMAFRTNGAETARLTTAGDWQLQAGYLDTKTGGSTTISTGVGSVKMSTANAATNTVWIPMRYNGNLFYVPGWTTNAP